MSNDSQDQKNLIIEQLLLGIDIGDIANSLGVGIGTVRAFKAHMTRGSYRSMKSSEIEEIVEAAEAVDVTFGLERDMQSALRANIDQLEKGLQIIDDGKERQVGSGWIDITATDSKGMTVIIELKAGTAKPAALTQLLSYMGSVSQEEARNVRGILVASDFDLKILHAVRVVPNVDLKKYRFNFKFDEVK